MYTNVCVREVKMRSEGFTFADSSTGQSVIRLTSAGASPEHSKHTPSSLSSPVPQCSRRSHILWAVAAEYVAVAVVYAESAADLKTEKDEKIEESSSNRHSATFAVSTCLTHLETLTSSCLHEHAPHHIPGHADLPALARGAPPFPGHRKYKKHQNTYIL